MMKYYEFKESRNNDEFKNKNKSIDNQQTEIKKKLNVLKKQKLQNKLDKFNKQKQDIQKNMNKFVAGASSY